MKLLGKSNKTDKSVNPGSGTDIILTAEQLRTKNQEYEVQYQNLGEDEVVVHFMKGFEQFIASEIIAQGYSDNPGQYLLSLANMGIFCVYVYHGSFPDEYGDQLMPFIRTHLIRTFGLKNFVGFHLEFQKKNRVGNFTSIKLCWNKPEDRAVIGSDGERARRRRSKSSSAKINDNLKKIKSEMRAMRTAQSFIEQLKASSGVENNVKSVGDMGNVNKTAVTATIEDKITKSLTESAELRSIADELTRGRSKNKMTEITALMSDKVKGGSARLSIDESS